MKLFLFYWLPGKDVWERIKWVMCPGIIAELIPLLFWQILTRRVKRNRKEAEVNMEGHFLVRQIYDDEVTYNIVGAAERVLSKWFVFSLST